MGDTLDVLDEWTERRDANVLIVRRLDLTAPDEWSAIFTCDPEDGPSADGPEQFTGKGMSPGVAIRRALGEAGVEVDG